MTVLFSPLTAAAQVPQVPQERTLPLEEQVQEEMASSPYRLGPVRLFPSFSLTNAGYNNNLFGTPAPTVSDWTADVSVGLHLLLPIGSKMYLRGDALPAYDWYAHHPELRTFGGLFGGDWLGFFNHLTTDVTGSSLQTSGPLNSEVQTQVTTHILTGRAGFQVNLTHQWWLLADGRGQRVTQSSPAETSVDRLDRDDYIVHAGILYRWSSLLDVSASVEGTQSSFHQEAEAQFRDNRTTAYVLSVYYRGDRLFVNANGGYRVARPYGSSFAGFSTATESYFVSYYLSPPLELQAYGHRAPGYSLFANNVYFMETRNGLGATLRIGRRIQLHGYGEVGTNDYPVAVPVPGGELIERQDRFTIVGGGLTFLFFRNAALNAQISKEKITSNYPGIARSIARFTTNLILQGIPTR